MNDRHLKQPASWHSVDAVRMVFGQALDRKGYHADRTMGRRLRRGLILAAEGGENDGA